MLTAFFSSSARIKLLGLLSLNPGQRYYLRQLAASLHLPIRAIQRETERLLRAGLLKKAIDGNRVYFQIMPEHFLYPEIKRMFLKILGARALLGEALQPMPTIQAAFVYGSFASDETTADGDVDLFVVGDMAMRQVKAALAKFREDTRRELKVYVTSAAEFRAAISRKDGYIYKVLSSPKVFIVGDEQALDRISS